MITREINNQDISRNYEAVHNPSDAPSLRDRLLNAPAAKGNIVALPRNTIAVEVPSATLHDEMYSALSDMVGRAQEGGEVGSRVSVLERAVLSDLAEKAEDRRLSDSIHNVTFLYDGQVELKDGELRTPSAAIVHGRMSERELKDLRAKLPEGVLLLDGRNNELLDSVGAHERQVARDRMELEGIFAATVLSEKKRDGRGYADYASLRGSNRDPLLEDRMWREFYAQRSEYPHVSHEGQRADGYPEVEGYVPSDAIPESKEVAVHGLMREKTGGRAWEDLSESEQRQVRRQIVSEVHPDRKDGDGDFLRAAEKAMPLKSRSDDLGSDASEAPSGSGS